MDCHGEYLAYILYLISFAIRFAKFILFVLFLSLLSLFIVHFKRLRYHSSSGPDDRLSWKIRTFYLIFETLKF